MQKCGLIGGIGPESTINYYASITRLFRERSGTQSGPPIVINSIDLPKMIALIQREHFEALADYLGKSIEECAAAGATFAALGACTPHLVLEELRRGASIPLLSIVEVTRDRAVRLGVRRAALFGTRFTMQAQFFPRVFADAGISIVPPAGAEQDYIHEKYFAELVNGVVLPDTRAHLIDIVSEIKIRENVDALILGGTELSLILSGESICGIHLLDTTAIHVQAITERMLQ